MSPVIETALRFSIRFTNRQLRQRIASLSEHQVILDAILSRDETLAAAEARGLLERALDIMLSKRSK
jgi:DNA-binding FadR family transcriptional regulator